MIRPWMIHTNVDIIYGKFHHSHRFSNTRVITLLGCQVATCFESPAVITLVGSGVFIGVRILRVGRVFCWVDFHHPVVGCNPFEKISQIGTCTP